MHRWDGPLNLRILKELLRSIVEGWFLSFSDLDRQDLKHHQMRLVSVGVSVGVSPQYGKHKIRELCLSPCVAKKWSQKLINLFVSETTESASIFIFICILVVIDMFMALQQNNESVLIGTSLISFLFIFSCGRYYYK